MQLDRICVKIENNEINYNMSRMERYHSLNVSANIIICGSQPMRVLLSQIVDVGDILTYNSVEIPSSLDKSSLNCYNSVIYF